MSVIFFWRWDNYCRDIQKEGKTFELNQDSEHISELQKGQHVWALTRREDKTYVLTADLVVVYVARNERSDPRYEYGRHRVVGDKQSSRYFDVDKGHDAETLIRSLSFSPQARILGYSFQGRNGVRPLTSEDEQKLTAFSTRLPTI